MSIIEKIKDKKEELKRVQQDLASLEKELVNAPKVIFTDCMGCEWKGMTMLLDEVDLSAIVSPAAAHELNVYDVVLCINDKRFRLWSGTNRKPKFLKPGERFKATFGLDLQGAVGNVTRIRYLEAQDKQTTINNVHYSELSQSEREHIDFAEKMGWGYDMNPEKDPFSVDLISRLTKAYSEVLWRFETASNEYGEYRLYCSSCGATKRYDETSNHNDGCVGVKLIIEALNYVNGC